MNVLAHCSYIGTTGINNHFREFYRALSGHCNLKVRNFTIGPNWEGLNSRPHDKEKYITDTDKKILYKQTLWNDGKRVDYPVYDKYTGTFDVNIVTDMVDHYYFYDEYVGPKIAYTVWEADRLPPQFFNRLKEYDEVWVPSQWQKDCTVAQGMPENKIQVVPGGVDAQTFYPEKIENDTNRFRFVIFGRWDYRKSTTEMIQTFLKTFGKNEPIDLIVSVDNPFADDGFKTTEERMEHHGISDDRIKIVHYASRRDYIKYLKQDGVFLSCARGEGWNLPLMEAMACGMPSIYSNCSGQLEFATGVGHSVNMIGLVSNPSNAGNFMEPDFEDLSRVMRDVYNKYQTYKQKAIVDSLSIRYKYDWKVVGKIGADKLSEFMHRINHKLDSQTVTFPLVGGVYKLVDSYEQSKESNRVIFSFTDGAKAEVLGQSDSQYEVTFIDQDTKSIVYSTMIKNNMWCAASPKYYVNWKIEIKKDGRVIAEENLDLRGKHVKVVLDTESIGDLVAFIGSVSAFQNKHGCKLFCVVFNNAMRSLLKNSYDNITFLATNEKDETYYAVYNIGYFVEWEHKLKRDPKKGSLIEIANQVLGVSEREYKPTLAFEPSPVAKKKYVCISTQSTAQCKYWNNPTGWDDVVKYLKGLGYDVCCIDRDRKFGIKERMNSIPKGAIDCTGDASLEVRLSQLDGAEFFIGLSSGLAWLAWAIGKPVVLISGFTEEYNEFYTPYRVINKNVCHGCWNDSVHAFDKTDWLWCPRKKNFECSKQITSGQVIEKIDSLLSIGPSKSVTFDFDKFFDKYREAIQSSGMSRYNFYKSVIPRLVAKNKPLHILETGTMSVPLENNMGAFTLIMGDLIKNHTGGKLYTVDLSPDNMEKCKKLTKEFSGVIEYVASDSLKFIYRLDDAIVSKFDLVYLDSHDFVAPNPHPSAQHHLNELMAIYDRLNSNCIIAIDDNWLPNTFIMWQWLSSDGNVIREERVETGDKILGKGMYCHDFLVVKNWRRLDELDIVGASNLFCYERPEVISKI